MESISRKSVLLSLLASCFACGLTGQVEAFTVAPADPVENCFVSALTVDSIFFPLSELPEGCTSIGGVILPISTPELTATRTDPTRVLLQWKTYDNDLTNRWVLQRQLVGADDFADVKQLSENNFLYGDHTDVNSFSGISYYRLYGISPEGEEVYSSVVAVGNVRQLGRLLVFPNPVTTVADINLPNADAAARLTLVDGLGRIVWRAVHPEGGATSLRLPDLKPGTYLLRWEGADEQVAVTRFVKRGH